MFKHKDSCKNELIFYLPVIGFELFLQDCLNAIGKHFHPECFLCAYCGKLFGNNPFFLEDGLPYCETGEYSVFHASFIYYINKASETNCVTL
jgi:hypothetical protein